MRGVPFPFYLIFVANVFALENNWLVSNQINHKNNSPRLLIQTISTNEERVTSERRRPVQKRPNDTREERHCVSTFGSENERKRKREEEDRRVLLTNQRWS